MTRTFTGKHFTAIMVVGFGIVMAVNFTMASYATGGFSGVVVENSYVASQKFNGWLEEAREQERLGWHGTLARDEQARLVVAAPGIPAGAQVSAELRRPIGRHETTTLVLQSDGAGNFRSDGPLAPGRWIARIVVTSDGQTVRFESEVG